MDDLISRRLHVDDLLLQALREDIPTEDVTTNAVMQESQRARVTLIAKQTGVIAGLDVFFRVFFLLDETAEMEAKVKDGDRINEGDVLAEIRANGRALLSGERTALNLLQRMSGIATHTRRLVDLLSGTGIMLLDTRKTTPLLRILEKYAVKVGGGANHRFGLSDGILLKDNHIAAAGGVGEAVARARAYAPFVRKIEVEVETLTMVEEALAATADIIMLDNMDDETMKKAVALIAGRAKVECSGNVTEERISRLSEIGVDYISCGALTHSSPILDMTLKHLVLL
ncbi:MAG: nicotinate-nucleotide diphosphorylase (carboxylating) [Firmicutes bacterium HGW-Firmicutes-11]|nr:MAG: nicotinate-nucleotide diphosphorylase (carboxylating) [Firmicutes bacterium HGW-Firmicutes-11]